MKLECLTRNIEKAFQQAKKMWHFQIPHFLRTRWDVTVMACLGMTAAILFSAGLESY